MGIQFDKCFRCGLLVGTHPIKTILISLVFALACLVGLLEFQQENRGEKLWVEQSSQFVEDQNWMRSKFPTRVRYINILMQGDDILTKNGLLTVSILPLFLFNSVEWKIRPVLSLSFMLHKVYVFIVTYF